MQGLHTPESFKGPRQLEAATNPRQYPPPPSVDLPPSYQVGNAHRVPEAHLPVARRCTTCCRQKLPPSSTPAPSDLLRLAPLVAPALCHHRSRPRIQRPNQTISRSRCDQATVSIEAGAVRHIAKKASCHVVSCHATPCESAWQEIDTARLLDMHATHGSGITVGALGLVLWQGLLGCAVPLCWQDVGLFRRLTGPPLEVPRNRQAQRIVPRPDRMLRISSKVHAQLLQPQGALAPRDGVCMYLNGQGRHVPSRCHVADLQAVLGVRRHDDVLCCGVEFHIPVRKTVM